MGFLNNTISAFLFRQNNSFNELFNFSSETRLNYLELPKQKRTDFLKTVKLTRRNLLTSTVNIPFCFKFQLQMLFFNMSKNSFVFWLGGSTTLRTKTPTLRWNWIAGFVFFPVLKSRRVSEYVPKAIKSSLSSFSNSLET